MPNNIPFSRVLPGEVKTPGGRSRPPGAERRSDATRHQLNARRALQIRDIPRYHQTIGNFPASAFLGLFVGNPLATLLKKIVPARKVELHLVTGDGQHVHVLPIDDPAKLQLRITPEVNVVPIAEGGGGRWQEVEPREADGSYREFRVGFLRPSGRHVVIDIRLYAEFLTTPSQT